MWMPRTDENGRQLKALLDYLLDGENDAKHIYDALGISSSTYYRRIKEVDYPNAEAELARVTAALDHLPASIRERTETETTRARESFRSLHRTRRAGGSRPGELPVDQ